MGGVHTSCLGSKSRYLEDSSERHQKSPRKVENRINHCRPNHDNGPSTTEGTHVIAQDPEEGSGSVGGIDVSPIMEQVGLVSDSAAQLVDVIKEERSVMRKAKSLVSKGISVNAPDQHGDTPLIIAVQLGNVPLVRFLLQHGADPNATNDHNGTALYYAIISGQCALAAILVDSGSDVNSRTKLAALPDCDISGTKSSSPSDNNVVKSRSRRELCNFPLAVAILRQCDQCFRLLIKAKVDINATDGDGRTALVHALAENPWSKMSYPAPGDLLSFHTRAFGELPRSFASLQTGSSILHSDRIDFAHALLARGADVMAVWEKILWCMWCQSPFDREALELCIRALPLVNLSERQQCTPGAGALFSSLLFHGLGRHMYLFYLSGFTPSVPKQKLLFNEAFTPWLTRVEGTPRTLQNTCVVRIRRAMAGKGNVIYKTEQLDIPDKLKQIITLDISGSVEPGDLSAYF